MSTWGGVPAGTTLLVTVHFEAALEVTTTWLDVTGAALDALIVPWLTAVVPTGVPAGNCALMATCAVVPGQEGVEQDERGGAGGGVVRWPTRSCPPA